MRPVPWTAVLDPALTEVSLAVALGIVVATQLAAFAVLYRKRAWAVAVAAGMVVLQLGRLWIRVEADLVPLFDFVKNVTVAFPFLVYLAANWRHARGGLSARWQRGLGVAFHVVLLVNIAEAVAAQGLQRPAGAASIANAVLGAVVIGVFPLRRWRFDDGSNLGVDAPWAAVLYALWNIGFVLDLFRDNTYIWLSVTVSNLLAVGWMALRRDGHAWFVARAITFATHLVVVKFFTASVPALDRVASSPAVLWALVVLAIPVAVGAARDRVR